MSALLAEERDRKNSPWSWWLCRLLRLRSACCAMLCVRPRGDAGRSLCKLKIRAPAPISRPGIDASTRQPRFLRTSSQLLSPGRKNHLCLTLMSERNAPARQRHTRGYRNDMLYPLVTHCRDGSRCAEAAGVPA